MDGKKTSVLVVDDEQSIRDFLTMGLEDEGYSVETAKDGLSALTKMHENPFDLRAIESLDDGDGAPYVVASERIAPMLAEAGAS